MNKDILRISYLILMIASLFASIYFIFGSMIASVYGGGEIFLFKIIWTFKGFIATILFSTIAFLGLKKTKKIGLLFSYSTSIGLGIYSIVTLIVRTHYEFNQDKQLDFYHIIRLIFIKLLLIGISLALVLSTKKIEKLNFQFKKMDYGIICGLSAILIFTWYSMFKFYY